MLLVAYLECLWITLVRVGLPMAGGAVGSLPSALGTGLRHPTLYHQQAELREELTRLHLYILHVHSRHCSDGDRENRIRSSPWGWNNLHPTGLMTVCATS